MAAPQMHGARWFSFAEIKKATNQFSKENEIGEGGYGKVQLPQTSFELMNIHPNVIQYIID